MEEKQMITIIDMDGVEKQVEVVAYFTLKMNDKDYLIYTENKIDETGNVEVCTGEVINKEDGTIEIGGVEDDAVWTEIKKVMIDIAKDGE